MRRLRSALVLCIALSGLWSGCSGPNGRPAVTEPAADLRALVDSVVAADDAVHGAALAVVSPALGLAWEGAAGFADPVAGTPMTPANPVRIASNTKTFTAATVLRLAEDGRLDLDAPVAGLLPAEAVEVLAGDGYDLDAITVRHLLTHTSGLFDHSEDPSFAEMIVAEPEKRWVPMDMITMAAEVGDPHAPPGEIYTYCDTGYILLGLIVERTTGLSLAESARELIDYDALGLDATWWETMEPAPAGVADRAHQFLGEIDTYAFDPSFDLYGGGGIATTTGDLARFFHAVFANEVYHDPATLGVMLSTLDGLRARPDASERALPPGAYRMGVWVLTTDGLTTYHHSGFWGTMAVYVPALDLTMAATVNQHDARTALDRISTETIRIVGAASQGS